MLRSKFFKTFLLLISGVFLFLSCDVTEPKPDCEKYDYGTVIVKNQTGYSIYVDVTWGNIWENYVKRLSNGSSTTYNEVPSGEIEIWASFDNSYWTYETYRLSSCEELSYKWTYNKSAEIDETKSAEICDINNLVLEISSNGEVIETITNFELKERN